MHVRLVDEQREHADVGDRGGLRMVGSGPWKGKLSLRDSAGGGGRHPECP